MQMAAMSKDVIKMKAYSKFQRMQQDSDRIARIEERLSVPKASGDDRLVSVVEDTARKIDKLGDRVSKLKEFSRDGTPRANIKKEVQEIADQVQELRHCVQDTKIYQQGDIDGLRTELGILWQRLETMSLEKEGSSGRVIQGGAINPWSKDDGNIFAPTRATETQAKFDNSGSRLGAGTGNETSSVYRRQPWSSCSDVSCEDEWGRERPTPPASQATHRKDSIGGWEPKILEHHDRTVNVAESDMDTRSEIDAKGTTQISKSNRWESPATHRPAPHSLGGSYDDTWSNARRSDEVHW